MLRMSFIAQIKFIMSRYSEFNREMHIILAYALNVMQAAQKDIDTQMIIVIHCHYILVSSYLQNTYLLQWREMNMQ